jgi:GT2 family glycosyltransferase
MNGPKVAVVILNWNGVKFLEQFLPSVMASTYANLELIVADNASTDHSLSFLATSYPQIRTIVLRENFGFAKGYNEALQQVQADYYVLLNSDVEVVPGWLEPMVQLCEADTTIAACQPKILAYHHKDTFEYAGAAGGWMDRYGYPFSRGRVFDNCEKDRGQYNDAVPVFWATGAALFIRAHDYHDMKGFDNYFFAHMEEIDLCWRLQQSGKQVYVCPQSVVYHVGGGTLPQGNSLKTFLNFRNNLIMLYKNLSWQQRIYIFPIRYALDTVTALKGLFAGQTGYFWAICRSHWAFTAWVFSKQKQSIFPKHKTNKVAGMYAGSVVWAYFIKKKKLFTEIVQKD